MSLSDGEAFNLLKDYLKPAKGPWELARVQQFSLIRMLGAGGFGIVYLAVDESANQLVALKILRPDKVVTDPKLRTRFLHEANSLKNIQSGHVVGFMAAGTIPNHDSSSQLPCICSEFVAGRTLDMRLSENDSITNRPWKHLAQIEALRIALDICKGLIAIHEPRNGKPAIVHRDLKPSNVILDSSRGERAKIMDFGLAWSDEIKDANLTTGILGTLRYLAPERLDPTDSAMKKPFNDVFSLGCILYEMLVGEPAFPETNKAACIAAIVQRDPVAPRVVDATINTELSALAMRMLSKNPVQRPTCREIEQTLMTISGSIARQLKEGPSRVSVWPKLSDVAEKAARDLVVSSLNVPDVWAAAPRAVLCGLATRLQISHDLNDEVVFVRDKLLQLDGELREANRSPEQLDRLNALDESKKTLLGLFNHVKERVGQLKPVASGFPALRQDLDRTISLGAQIYDIAARVVVPAPASMEILKLKIIAIRRDLKSAITRCLNEIERHVVCRYQLALDRLLVEIARDE